MRALLAIPLASLGAALLAPPMLASEPPPPTEKKICKRETRIGTLAGRQRVCHTAAEWKKIAERARDTLQGVQGSHGSSHGFEPPELPPS